LLTRVKCFVFSAAVVLAVALTVGFFYSRNCSVKADNSNLPEEAASFMRRGWPMLTEEDLCFYDAVDIGANRFVLMEVAGGEFEDMSLGLLRLQRGWNGRYRIESVGYGGGNFRNEAVERDGRWYLLFGGRNAYFGIAQAEFQTEGEVYRLDVPKKERFLTVTELKGEPEIKHLLPVDQIRFYDAGGRDITEEIPWN